MRVPKTRGSRHGRQSPGETLWPQSGGTSPLGEASQRPAREGPAVGHRRAVRAYGGRPRPYADEEGRLAGAGERRARARSSPPGASPLEDWPLERVPPFAVLDFNHPKVRIALDGARDVGVGVGFFHGLAVESGEPA